MRMYNMYFICKSYLERVKEMGTKPKSLNGSTVYFIDNWKNNAELLNNLAKVAPLKSAVKEIIDSIPIVNQDENRFDLSNNTRNKYEKALNRLVISMQAIVDAYEVLGVKNTYETSDGFDLKLPQFKVFLTS